MINTIKKLLGIGNATNYHQLINDGALIVDVRTPAEFAAGHIKNAINISLDILKSDDQCLKTKTKLSSLVVHRE